MSRNSKNGKSLIFKITAYIIVIISEIGFGILLGTQIKNFSSIQSAESFTEIILYITILIIAVYTSMFAQIIVHEAGHLVFGLLTGYKFISFRIFNIMFIKEDEQIKLKKYSLAGTAGQCLLSPPDSNNGKLPVVLYNLGGVFMNIISCLICIGLYFAFKSIPFLAELIIIFAFFGFITAITNGMPIKMKTVNNDGSNTLELIGNENARNAIFIQMKIVEKSSKNVRLKDMPEEWFTLQSDEDIKNSLNATINVFACNRLVDAHKFDEADMLMKHLLESDNGVVGLHKKLMICDRIFIELITENRKEVLKNMLDKEQQRFMKQMKNYPSVIRTEYLYALLAEKNIEKAEKLKAQFEKCAEKYPYPSGIESERELIEIGEKQKISEN